MQGWEGGGAYATKPGSGKLLGAAMSGEGSGSPAADEAQPSGGALEVRSSRGRLVKRKQWQADMEAQLPQIGGQSGSNSERNGEEVSASDVASDDGHNSGDDSYSESSSDTSAEDSPVRENYRPRWCAVCRHSCGQAKHSWTNCARLGDPYAGSPPAMVIMRLVLPLAATYCIPSLTCSQAPNLWWASVRFGIAQCSAMLRGHLMLTPEYAQVTGAGGIFKTAAVAVLRSEMRLMSTGVACMISDLVTYMSKSNLEHALHCSN